MYLHARSPVRIVHHKHTGKKVPFHCTSYAFLFLLLLFAAVVLFVVTQKVAEAASGNIGVSGVVLGVPPQNPPTIESPSDKFKTDKNEVKVSGQCTPGLVVEVYRSGTLAGTDICAPDGSFEITIILDRGKNTIVARMKDWADQYSPDSGTISVYYVPRAASGTTGAGGGKPASNTRTGSGLTVRVLPPSRSVQENNKFTFKYRISGGSAPYAVSIDWDNNQNNSLQSIKKSGESSLDYTFLEPGIYQVIIRVQDSKNNQAMFQTAILVTSKKITTPVLQIRSDVCDGPENDLLTCALVSAVNRSWPALIIAGLMTISFWAGERLILVRQRRLVAHGKNSY